MYNQREGLDRLHHNLALIDECDVLGSSENVPSAIGLKGKEDEDDCKALVSFENMPSCGRFCLYLFTHKGLCKEKQTFHVVQRRLVKPSQEKST